MSGNKRILILILAFSWSRITSGTTDEKFERFLQPQTLKNDLKQTAFGSFERDSTIENSLADIWTLWRESYEPESIFKHILAALDEQDENLDKIYDCAYSVLMTINSKSDWALRMMDATGKAGTSSGMLEGNLHGLGSYQECVSISVPESKFYNKTIPPFTGRYSLSILSPNPKQSQKMSQLRSMRHDDYGILNSGTPLDDFLLGILLATPRLGVCSPSLCSGENVAAGLNVLLNITYKNLNISGAPYIHSVGDYNYVEDDNKELTVGTIAAIAVVGVIVGMALVGTALDLKSSKPSGILPKIFLCFSVTTNSRKMFSTKKSDGTIECLNGIKFLSMCWVVLGHTWYVASFVPWTNPFGVTDIYDDSLMMILFGAVLAVDSFFLLSGFLMSYLTWTKVKEIKGIGSILLIYLHRYIRLTPAYGMIMLTFATISVHLGSGPFWQFMVIQRERCENNWWTNILYINNYVPRDGMCMGESWYLACDFQMFLIGPPLVLALSKFPKIGLPAVLTLLVASVAVPGGLTAANSWPAQQTLTLASPSWFNDFYITTHTRASPYVFGILAGYLVRKYYEPRQAAGKTLPKTLVFVGWFLSLSFCLTSLFGLKAHWELDFKCLDGSCTNVPVNAAYAALGRLAWAMGLFWVIFACSTGNGGWVNKFLSWPMFSPLSRLTFCTYLIHLHLMYIFHFGRNDVMEFGQYLMVYLFFAHLVISLFFAFICSILFESPFIGLEKIIFGGGGGKKRPRDNGELKEVKNGVSHPTHSKTNEA